MRPIRMVVISSNTLTRSAITQIVAQSRPLIEIVGTFPDFQSAVHYLNNHGVEVILIDDSLPHQANLSREIKALSQQRISVAVIVILQRPTVSLVQQLLAQGFRGIIHKLDKLEAHLVQAIVLAKQRGLYLSPGVSRLIDAQRTLPVPLGPREYDVLKLLANGLEPKAIVSHIGLGKPTVYRIIRSLRARLNAQNNAHLIAIAHQEKLLEVDRID